MTPYTYAHLPKETQHLAWFLSIKLPSLKEVTAPKVKDIEDVDSQARRLEGWRSVVKLGRQSTGALSSAQAWGWLGLADKYELFIFMFIFNVEYRFPIWPYSYSSVIKIVSSWIWIYSCIFIYIVDVEMTTCLLLVKSRYSTIYFDSSIIFKFETRKIDQQIDYKTQNRISETIQPYLLPHQTNVGRNTINSELFSHLWLPNYYLNVIFNSFIANLYQCLAKDVVTVRRLQYRQHFHRSWI